MLLALLIERRQTEQGFFEIATSQQRRAKKLLRTIGILQTQARGDPPHATKGPQPQSARQPPRPQLQNADKIVHSSRPFEDETSPQTGFSGARSAPTCDK